MFPVTRSIRSHRPLSTTRRPASINPTHNRLPSPPPSRHLLAMPLAATTCLGYPTPQPPHHHSRPTNLPPSPPPTPRNATTDPPPITSQPPLATVKGASVFMVFSCTKKGASLFRIYTTKGGCLGWSAVKRGVCLAVISTERVRLDLDPAQGERLVVKTPSRVCLDVRNTTRASPRVPSNLDDRNAALLQPLDLSVHDFHWFFNEMKRFVPQQELSTEEAFWYHMLHPSTKASDALLVKAEAPKELPKDEWGFEHTTAVLNNEIIPFLKSLKDIFIVFDKDLLNERMEVQTVFDQIDAAVQQSSVDKQCLEIAKKELLLEIDRLLQQIMSQDIRLTMTNSMSLIGAYMNMERKQNESCDKCFNLNAELLKS
nr:hypothetical protein [Tanacetum cinerariifolium]